MVGWIVALISGVLIEYSGSFEYRSDETDKFVGQYRMGTAVSVDCLYYSLAHQG